MFQFFYMLYQLKGSHAVAAFYPPRCQGVGQGGADSSIVYPISLRK